MRANISLRASAICFVANLCAFSDADAVTNGSFELIDVPSVGYTDVADGDVDGWVITEDGAARGIEFNVDQWTGCTDHSYGHCK